MGVTISAIDQEDFDEYPEPKAVPTEDPYADLIPVLQSRGFAEITVEPPTTMRGARIAIGRLHLCGLRQDRNAGAFPLPDSPLLLSHLPS